MWDFFCIQALIERKQFNKNLNIWGDNMSGNDIKLLIYEYYDSGRITENEKNELLEELTLKLLYNDFLMEAENIVKKGYNWVKDKSDKVANSSVARAYQGALDKGADFASKKVVKEPPKGSSPEIYKEYEKKLKQWKLRFKAGEILAAQVIAVGPLDFLVSAMNGVVISHDPDLKPILDKVKDKGRSLLDKVKELNNRLKNGSLTEDKLKKEVNAITTAGAAVAKQADTIANKKYTPIAANESTFDILDSYVMENGEVTNDGYDILNVLIEKTDFSERPEMFDIICHYCGI